MKVLSRPEPLVQQWFDILPKKISVKVIELSNIVQQCDTNLIRGVHWGNLVFSYNGRALLAISTHKSHINLQVFNAALLIAKFPMLLVSDKQAMHLKCRLNDILDDQLIQDIVHESLKLAIARTSNEQETGISASKSILRAQVPTAPNERSALFIEAHGQHSERTSPRPAVIVTRVQRRRIVRDDIPSLLTMPHLDDTKPE